MSSDDAAAQGEEPGWNEMLQLGVTPIHLAVASDSLELVQAVLDDPDFEYPDPLELQRRRTPTPLFMLATRPGASANFRLITLLCLHPRSQADLLLELPLELIDVPLRVASQMPSLYASDYDYYLRFSLVVSHCLVAQLVLDPLGEEILRREVAASPDDEAKQAAADPLAALLDEDEAARARKLEMATQLHVQMFRSLGFGGSASGRDGDAKGATDGSDDADEGGEGAGEDEGKAGGEEGGRGEDGGEAAEVIRLAAQLDRAELAPVVASVARVNVSMPEAPENGLGDPRRID